MQLLFVGLVCITNDCLLGKLLAREDDCLVDCLETREWVEVAIDCIELIELELEDDRVARDEIFFLLYFPVSIIDS